MRRRVLLTSLLVGSMMVSAASAQDSSVSLDHLSMYGINRTTGALKRYHFSSTTLEDIATVTDAQNQTLLGIEASAYIPGHTNIYGFWIDPATNQTRLVYINRWTGLATPVGMALGADPIRGAVATPSATGQWAVYAVQHVEAGLIGGHFDVDTSTSAGSSTDAHVHQYDDKFDVLGIDAFAYHESQLQEIGDIIDPGVRFKLITVNASLSSAAQVRINGSVVPITPDHNELGAGHYTIGDLTGATKLTGLRVDFQKNAIPDGGLVPTETKLVRSNTPGPNGEYRNGAFTIQAVRVNADGSPAYTLGTNGAATSGLLWETTLFWHTKRNKKDGTWTMNVKAGATTGRLIYIDHKTGASVSLMALDRSYNSLAASPDSQQVFIGASESRLYRIDVAAGTETSIGCIPAMPAMEYAGVELVGVPFDKAAIRKLDDENGGTVGPAIDTDLYDLGTIIFAPEDIAPHNKPNSYD